MRLRTENLRVRLVKRDLGVEGCSFGVDADCDRAVAKPVSHRSTRAAGLVEER